MGSKTKKIRAAGKFRVSSGTRSRKIYNAIEEKQRQRQPSPFYPKARAKRIAAGIWKCMKTGKIFADDAYYLQKSTKLNK